MIGNRLTQSYRNDLSTSPKEKGVSNVNHVSANQKNAMGDENVGDKLNRIADANWVDPSKTRKVGKDKLDKDDFLKLMLTQMKFQDPTTPLESHQMASQLAQFTSLEQMKNMNTNIEKLAAGNKPNAQFQALQFIGKSIESDSSKVFRGEGDKSHEVRFNLGKDAKDIEVNIKDAEGDVVKSYTLHDLKKGQNSLTWNGMNGSDELSRAGTYKVEVLAKDSNGGKIVSSMKVAGTITGVNYSAQGPMLMIGNQSVPMSEVRKIVDPSAKQAQGTEVRDVTKLALNNDTKTKDNSKSGASSQKIIDDVPMAGDLLNRVKKLTQ